ncbi:MAG: DNA polymerase/3'-5' exonuclease PolX [Patescibacteria group bacterium]
MKPFLSNHEIADALREMAVFYEMDSIPFKPQAYEKAAESLDTFDTEASALYTTGGIKAMRTIPGVGEGIARHIEALLSHGTFPEYTKYKKQIPVNLAELRGVQGLGAKNIKTLYQKLKIKNLRDLETAALAGKIEKIPHFGKRSQDNFLKGIEFLKKNRGRFLLGEIDPVVMEIESFLKKIPSAEHVITAGSYRRRQETLGDIDMLATAKHPKKITDAFTRMPGVSEILAHGTTKAIVRMKLGIEVDLRVVPEESYGAALQYFTGSKEHNVLTRKIAIAKGLKLNEYGIFKGKKQIAGRTEEDVYHAIGLIWIDPELRTATGEIEAALRQAQGKTHCLPKIIPYGSLRGDLQVQTDWTDGQDSLEAMADAAREAGLEYIAITDHTKALTMTGGLDEKGLARQAKVIEKLNEKLSPPAGLAGVKNEKFKILKSAELNILKDGSLDIHDTALGKLDIVAVSIHSHFNLTEKEQTERIIRAMKHPLVNILFHPTGRLIQKREAYAVDMGKIIRAAKEYGVALEVNASPERLDLKDTHIRMAVEAGVKLVINSDAHATSHFGFLNFGVAQARRGWATAKDVLNTLPCESFLKALKGLKKTKT